MTTTEPTSVDVLRAEAHGMPDRDPTTRGAAIDHQPTGRPHGEVDGAASSQQRTAAGAMSGATKSSPDPNQGTDRYRLVTPFTLRL